MTMLLLPLDQARKKEVIYKTVISHNNHLLLEKEKEKQKDKDKGHTRSPTGGSTG
jgi:hypothetical protein